MPTCGVGSALLIDPQDYGKRINVSIWQDQGVWAFINTTHFDKVRKLARENECILCPPGFYSYEKDSPFCYPAPVGYYVPEAGMSAPLSCKPHYPRYSAIEGQTWCNGIFLNISDDGFWSLTVVYFIWFFIMLLCAGPDNFFAIFFFNIGPALDLLSDVQYILTTPFYNENLFISCVLFIFLPSLFFLKLLLEKQTPLFAYKLVDICKAGTYESCMTDLVDLCQGNVHLSKLPQNIFFGLWIIITTAVFFFIFALGALCYQSKVIAIKSVWDSWVFVWTASSNYRMEDFAVDTEILNESLFSEFLFETLPQIIIQNVNTIATDQFTSVQAFSTALSAFITLNGLVTFGYYWWYQGKSMGEIPTKTAILFFLSFELETNDQIENRKELDRYYERLVTRDIRIKKYERENDILR